MMRNSYFPFKTWDGNNRDSIPEIDTGGERWVLKAPLKTGRFLTFRAG